MPEVAAFLNSLGEGPGFALTLIGMTLAIGFSIFISNIGIGFRNWLSPPPVYCDCYDDDDDPDPGDEDEPEEEIERTTARVIRLDKRA